MEGNATRHFDVLTPINFHYISVTMKQKHCELVLQVSLQKLQCFVIKAKLCPFHVKTYSYAKTDSLQKAEPVKLAQGL